MKIHEYQAKAILKKYGVAVPRGEMAETREEAEAVAKSLFAAGASGVVVKAQIHAGGRGKGGGVKIAKSAQEAGDLAPELGDVEQVAHGTGTIEELSLQLFRYGVPLHDDRRSQASKNVLLRGGEGGPFAILVRWM